MMQATIPCILVVGCADVGKKTLILRITGSSDQQVPILWTIDTKYYIAQAKFVSRECSSDNSQLSRDCESLILVFDAEREETFRAAKQWLADQNINPEISLLVANKSELLRHDGGAVQRQPWHGEAQDWCCEHLFEYIEVISGDLHFVNALLEWCSALNAHPMQALIASHLSLSLSQPHFIIYLQVSAADEEADESLQLDGDPQGVKRVLEALEAHTWPGLRLKANQNGSSISNGTHVSAANASELPNSGEHGPHSQAGSNHRQYWADQAEVERAQSSMQEPAGTEPDELSARAAGETDLPLGSGTNGQNGIAAPAGSQSEQEVELENFEAMLGRLSDARHQFQGIPDDERRARAAAFAMQMMESLGLDDDDDLDVDDDSSIGN